MDKRDIIHEEGHASTNLPLPSSTSNGTIDDSAHDDAAAAEDTFAPALPTLASAAPQPGRLELFDDVDAGPPVPFAMTAASVAAEKGESVARRPPADLVQIEDDAGPFLPLAMADLFDVSNDEMSKKKPAAKNIDLEIDHNHDGPSVPFDFAAFEDRDDLQKKKAMRAKGKGSDIPLLTSNGIIPGAHQMSNDAAPLDRVVNIDEPQEDEGDDDCITLPQEDGVEDYSIGTSTVPFNTFANREAQTYPSSNANAAPPTVERESSVIHIPEAFRVEEGDDHFIIDGHAEPLLPWWKQRRTKILLTLILFVIIAAVIAIGVSFSMDRTSIVTELVGVAITSSPTSSAVPTVEQSSSPSLSLAPSSSPSECAIKISNKVQEFKLLIDNPINTKFAMDGRNAVVIAQDPNIPAVYVMFYSLEDGVWNSVNSFIEYVDDIYDADVALSGSTALVGVGYKKKHACKTFEAIVHIYEQNSRGLWIEERGKEPPIPAFDLESFGKSGTSVGIDGDFVFICVHGGFGGCGSSYQMNGYIYIYRRNETNWIETSFLRTTVPLEENDFCSIAGNTIAISGEKVDPQLYEYVSDRSYAETLCSLEYDYDWNPRYSVQSLSKDYLVIATRGNDLTRVFIYHRHNTDQPFTFLQSFNSSEYDNDFGRNLAIEKDMLIVSGSNQTYVFSLQRNGNFNEALRLNQGYDNYQVSGRNIIAEKNNTVYAFSIEDCFQLLPTTAPSMAPSLAPSSSPSQSHAPTLSLRPSSVEQAIAYQEAEERYAPLWFEPTPRAGTAYLDAIEFCAEKEGYEMCHYEAICPLGPGSEPLGGAKGLHESWAPVVNRINEWAQVGSQSPCVKQYSNENLEPPEQNQSGFDKEDLTRHIACCLVPKAPSQTQDDPIPCYNIKLNLFNGYKVVWDIAMIYPHHKAQGEYEEYSGSLVSDSTPSDSACLPEGFYKLHIFLEFAHNIFPSQCDNALDYIEISLNDQIVALEDAVQLLHDFSTSVIPAYGPGSCEAFAIFAIPFDQIPSNPPSQSSSTLSPTVSSTASLHPTNECFWVEIMLDEPYYTYESSWDLERISATGDSAMVKSNKAKWDNSNICFQSLCLEKGQYQFTIYDSYGDGIYMYALSTYGEDIVRGGASGTSETTTFNIPFDPKTNPTWSPTTTPTRLPTTPRPTWSATIPAAFPTWQPNQTWPPTITQYPTPSQWTPFPTYIPTSQASPSPSIETTPPKSSTPSSTPPQTQQPSTPIITTNITCATQEDCDKQRQKMGFANFYPGDYADYGCFSKYGISYWGMGGTDEQISIDPLGGLKERIWCEEIL